MHKVAILHDRIGGKAGGGGGVRELRELAHGLRDLGHEPLVLCHDLSRSSDFETSLEGVEVRAVREVAEGEGGGRLELARRYLREMPALAELVPDDVTVVHAQGWPALRAGRIAASRTGVPFVWTTVTSIIGNRRSRAEVELVK